VRPSERTTLVTTILANIAGPDLLIIVGIIVLLFGSSQLPKLARSLGQASKEFKKGVSDEEKDDADGTEGKEKKS
jgi:sec-independent protein translocase protein TatA